MKTYDPRARFGRPRRPSPSNVTLQGDHNHHVTVSFDDETKGLIERFNSALELLADRMGTPDICGNGGD